MERMTWGQFKAAAEAAGVTDDMVIDLIDVCTPAVGERLEIDTQDGIIAIENDMLVHDDGRP